MELKSIENVDFLFRRISLYSDEKAFHTLFQYFFSPLSLYAHRYIDDMETCEDIVQEVFYRIWRDRKGLNIQSSGRGYLMMCVRNNCLDLIRKQQIERKWMEGVLDSQEEEEEFDLYATVELEQLFNDVLKRLPERVSTIFCMQRMEGKTYVEIAKELDISVKTVEADMSKALKFLRQELKEYLPLFMIFFPHLIG